MEAQKGDNSAWRPKVSFTTKKRSPISPVLQASLQGNGVSNSTENSMEKKPQSKPATAAVNSIHWDVEEDHLLSYFLGANDGTNDSNPESEISITVDPTSLRRSFQSSGIAGNHGITAMDSMLENFVSARAKESSDGLTNATSTSTYAPSMGAESPARSVHFDDGNLRPPLANQHMFRPSASDNTSSAYASQQQWQSSDSLHNRSSSVESMHKVLSTSSTASHGSASSLLTSMASALALGEPNQVMYMQQKLQIRDQLTCIQYQNTSPITPVNLLGTPQEMMMLPPPPRFPNGCMPGVIQQHHQSFGQRHMVHSQQQQQQYQQQQLPMIQAQMPQPQAAPLHFAQQTVNAVSSSETNVQQRQQEPNFLSSQINVQHQQRQQQPSFLPSQSNVQQRQQQPNFLPQMNPTHSQPMEQNRHMGFPDPNSFMSSSSILPPRQSQPQQSQQPQQQGVPFQQQIQIGLNGQTIPITAVPGANGSIFYQVDPSVVPTSGLRYFTKAINELSKADEQKEIDPDILAEKRRQRLARNRESARQSRRRKKEHLASLAAKVQKLQRQLEAEVRSKIRSMEGGLSRQRCNMVEKWLAEQEKKRFCPASDEHSSSSVDSRDCWNQLAMFIGKTSVNCEIRRAVIAHQYHFLRQAFISTHNHFSVWMMMQSSSFFTEASRRQEVALAKTGVAAGSISSGSESASKTASSRANSKQIGEDIYNDDRKLGKVGVTCHANDGLRMWPLYCHEITMTMEQEDRVINHAHAQAKNTPELQSKLQQMKAATDATHHLQNATLCHTQLTSQRNNMLLLDILTPAQASLFMEWHVKNKERCKAVMERQLRASVAAVAGSAEIPQGESILDAVCRQLEKTRTER